ncbi:MAG: hypothetical protein ACTSW4_01410 [Candidatus Ranarchaeia archaeon]
MTWKAYYTIAADKFEQAVDKIKQMLPVTVEQDEDRIIIFSNEIQGFEKFRASMDIDRQGNTIYKIIGIIEDFRVLSLMEPYLGPPDKIRAPKPSILDFAHVVVSCKQLELDKRIIFLRENLGLSTIEIGHYVKELKASATRPTAEEIIRKAATLL